MNLPSTSTTRGCTGVTIMVAAQMRLLFNAASLFLAICKSPSRSTGGFALVSPWQMISKAGGPANFALKASRGI